MDWSRELTPHFFAREIRVQRNKVPDGTIPWTLWRETSLCAGVDRGSRWEFCLTKEKFIEVHRKFWMSYGFRWSGTKGRDALHRDFRLNEIFRWSDLCEGAIRSKLSCEKQSSTPPNGDTISVGRSGIKKVSKKGVGMKWKFSLTCRVSCVINFNRLSMPALKCI